MTTTLRTRRLPVWPFHALGLVAVVLGGTFVVGWWPEQYPAESELVKLSGKVSQIVVRDDISGTTAGAMLPGWTSTYFTLSGVEGEFRYPRTQGFASANYYNWRYKYGKCRRKDTRYSG